MRKKTFLLSINSPGLSSVSQDIDNTSIDRPKLKSGMTVRVMLKDSDVWEDVKLMSRSGKAGRGKYPNSWNTTNDSGQGKSVDFDRDVADWVDQTPTEQHVDEILISSEIEDNKSAVVAEAKMTELQSWKDEDVYDEISDEGQSCMSVRWVVGEKEGPDKNTIVKARLCARGFEE